MSIILKCRDTSGSVAFPAGMVAGLPVAERRYQIEHGLVTLDGYPDAVLRHDMLELLQMPDGLYRLLTPSEQRTQAETVRAALTVEEAVPAKGKAKSSESNGG